MRLRETGGDILRLMYVSSPVSSRNRTNVRIAEEYLNNMDSGGRDARKRAQYIYKELAGLSRMQLRIVMIQYAIIRHEKMWYALLVLALATLLFSASCKPSSEAEGFAWGILVGVLLLLVLIAAFIRMGNGNNHK